jgi:hypothetical protein
MALSQQYTNPPITPCTGTYSWVPPTSPNIGGVNPLLGFYDMVINRGAFRNYSSPVNTSNSNIKISVDSGNTISGDYFSPVKNATRPLALSYPVNAGNGENYVVGPTSSNDLITFNFPTNDDYLPLSCVEITYDLSFFNQDPLLNNYNLNTIQQTALSDMQSATGALNPTDITNFITGLQPSTIDVIGVDSSGKETVINVGISSTSTAGLNLTRVRSTLTESNLQFFTSSASSIASGPTFNTVILKTGTSETDRNAYPKYKSIILRAKSTFSGSSSTLVLLLQKVMFFTADRVNLRFDSNQNQLPCAALGYSMTLNGSFYPSAALGFSLASAGGSLVGGASADFSGATFWPQDVRPNGCNTHVKIFSPDYTSGSPGFSHSLNLHLMLLTFPTFGPLADFLLPGVTQPYFGVIIGPVPFTEQFIFYGNSIVSSTPLAAMASESYKVNSGTVTLLQNGQIVGNPLSIYNFTDGLSFIQNNQFYYEQLGIAGSSIFQNSYIDSFGNPTISGNYTGSPNRLTQFLNAYESTVSITGYSKKQYSYSTYVTTSPNLYNLFTKSNPCLIFQCNSDGFGNSIILQPGFISAAINAFATDTTGLFDTKLVYRIYAAPTNSYDPNSDFAKKHTFKIDNSNPANPQLLISNFDSTWDFGNVLVTGNLESNLNTVIASEIINTSSNSFVISKTTFQIYCAIYTVSSLNDNVSNYNLKNNSSLDYPVVTFSITNDFILTLPLYYLKSYTNGGTLQAIHDFGYTGTYTPDANSYIVTNTLYNGETFNTSNQYAGLLSGAGGFSNLFEFVVNNSSITPSNTQFSIFINAGTATNPSITETDYVFNISSTSNTKIASGLWEIDFVLASNNEIKNALIKFEIDLYDKSNSNLILKVITSQYQNISTNTISSTITVPFFLPLVSGILITKIYVLNSSSEGILYFSSVSISKGKNTLEYFSYTGRPIESAPIGFYEDLPLQPNAYVGGCTEFALYLDLPSSGFTIFDPTQGLNITGALYSPTWVVALPSNMEVGYITDVNSNNPTGVQPYEIYFRTGTTNSIKVLDTKRHNSTGLIVTMTNTSTNNSNTAVAQVASESYARFFTYQTMAQTVYTSGSVVNLDLENPMMSRSEELLVQGQQNNASTIQTVCLNNEAPGSFSNQPTTGGTLLPLDNSNAIKVKFSNCSFVTFDYQDFKTHTVGVTPHGNIVYSVDQFNTTAQSGNFILIEGGTTGNSASELSNFEISTIGMYYGSAKVSYPGIIVSNLDTLIFYVYSTGSNIVTNYAIYARSINGSNLSNPVLIFNFYDYCSKVSSIDFNFPSIDQITIAKHDIYQNGKEFYLAFDCFQKIFVLKLGYNQKNYFVSSLNIIYGNLINSNNTSEQSFINCLNNLISSGLLYKLPYVNATGAFTKNMENSQRVGFVDFDGIYLGVQFIDGNNIQEIVFEKSFTLAGELRTIGTISGG